MAPANILPTCPATVNTAVRLAISSDLLLNVRMSKTTFVDHILPRAHDINGPSIGAGLGQSHEEAHRRQLLKGLARSTGHCAGSPHNDH